MNAKHTPGPYTVKGTRIYAADGGEIAVATKASPKWRDSAEATAVFLGAAPEMYEALEAIVSTIDKTTDTSVQFTVDWICRHVGQWRAALAKARGEVS